MRLSHFPQLLPVLMLGVGINANAHATPRVNAPDMPPFTELLASESGWAVARHIDPHEPAPAPLPPVKKERESNNASDAPAPPTSTRFCALYTPTHGDLSQAQGREMPFMLVAGPQGWKFDSVRSSFNLIPGQQSALTIKAGQDALPLTMFNATPDMEVTYLTPTQTQGLIAGLKTTSSVTLLFSLHERLTLTLPHNFPQLLQTLESCVPSLGYPPGTF